MTGAGAGFDGAAERVTPGSSGNQGAGGQTARTLGCSALVLLVTPVVAVFIVGYFSRQHVTNTPSRHCKKL